jgi:hypothetical protein
MVLVEVAVLARDDDGDREGRNLLQPDRDPAHPGLALDRHDRPDRLPVPGEDPRGRVEAQVGQGPEVRQFPDPAGHHDRSGR